MLGPNLILFLKNDEGNVRKLRKVWAKQIDESLGQAETSTLTLTLNRTRTRTLTLTLTLTLTPGARLGRARKTLRLPLDGGDGGRALAQQLAFLHGHPRVAVVEQRESDDGRALEVVADMDEGTHRMFIGQSWT